MRAVIQRVSQACVSIDGKLHGEIGRGLLVLLGIHKEDHQEDAEWLCQKIAALRVFADSNGLMNLSLEQASGQLLIVSQFTLIASYKKGNRPSFIEAARPEHAIPLYEYCKTRLAALTGKAPECGQFGADMEVQLTNDGPVTIIMDTRNKE